MNQIGVTRTVLRSRVAGIKSRSKKIATALLATVGLGFALSGCSPFYVLRAAYEEGKILWRREPITELLHRPDVAEDTQEKLRLVLSVRDYARDVLKLNVGGSYASYSYVDRPDLTYIVVAAPKTELRPYTWWFPIVGHVPYKGFFSKQAAYGEVKRLQAEGYDTNVRISAAFSTLGWFDDPLLGHLLKYDKVTLAELVFHELFHNTVYVKGAGAFNESLANFIGHRSAIDFFAARLGWGSTEHQRAQDAWHHEKEFAGFIKGVISSVAEVYRLDIPRNDKLRLRDEVFSRSKAYWADRMDGGSPSRRFRAFARQPLNNAILMHYLVYLSNLELFESLYEAENKKLDRFIATIREPVKSSRDPFSVVESLLEKRGTRSAYNPSTSRQ
jgi:predicted aminopeptidase